MSVLYLYLINCGIEIDINILVVTIYSAELFTLSLIPLCFTISLSLHTDFAVISNEGLFLFYLRRVISITGQPFCHLDLFSYQNRLRNPK